MDPLLRKGQLVDAYFIGWTAALAHIMGRAGRLSVAIALLVVTAAASGREATWWR